MKKDSCGCTSVLAPSEYMVFSADEAAAMRVLFFGYGRALVRGLTGGLWLRMDDGMKIVMPPKCFPSIRRGQTVDLSVAITLGRVPIDPTIFLKSPGGRGEVAAPDGKTTA